MRYGLLLTLACGMCLANAWHSWHDTRTYGGTDLRVRVVGARAILRGINPYAIAESENLDPALRDPDQMGLSRCTYPPTLLLFYSPLSSISYRQQRAIWAVLEWLAFAASLILLTGCLPSQSSRYWFCLSAIGLFGGSWFWRLHVERGQYYIFVVLIISLGIRLIINNRHFTLAGCVWGIAISLRPTTLLLVAPWLFDFRRKTGLAAIATSIIVVALATAIGKVEYWQHFLNLSSAWEMSLLGKDIEPTSNVLPVAGPTDGYVGAIMPGFASNLTILSFSKSLQTTLGSNIDPVTLARLSKVVWLLVISLIWAFSRRTEKEPSDLFKHRLRVGVCLMLVTDYFLPIRIEYADVMFLLPLALLVPNLLQKENRFLAVAGAVAMLSHHLSIFKLPFDTAALTSMMRSAAAVSILVRLTTRPGSSKE